MVKRVRAQVSAEGCFDLLDFTDLENKTGATLVLDANYYLDAQTQEKRLRLQGKCQLAEMPAAGVSWETDDNGFAGDGSREREYFQLSLRQRRLSTGQNHHCER